MDIVTLIEQGAILLAPMAGITDSAFRILCKEQGADILCSEMVSLQALYYEDAKTKRLMMHRPTERPFVLQVFGQDPVVAAKVVREKLNSLEDVDALDLNMGCPAPKIVKNGSGSALLKEESKALQMVEALVKNSRFPVGIKLRLGWDEGDDSGLLIAQKAQHLGVSWITLHGRSRAQYYSGQADWEKMRMLKQKLNLPFVANGDIFTPEDAKRAYEYIQPNALMIGRGAFGNPWLFGQIKSHLTKGQYEPVSVFEKLEMAKRHMGLLSEIKGEKLAVKEMRKHLGFYFKGIFNGAKMRDQVNKLNTQQEVLAFLADYMQLLRNREEGKIRSTDF